MQSSAKFCTTKFCSHSSEKVGAKYFRKDFQKSEKSSGKVLKLCVPTMLNYNGLGLCVRAGFRSTKADIITKVQLKNCCRILHFSPPDAKPLLAAGLNFAKIAYFLR